MNPILMKDFIVIDVKEEYEGDFSNFNGTFVPSTYTPLYSTTIEIKKDEMKQPLMKRFVQAIVRIFAPLL